MMALAPAHSLRPTPEDLKPIIEHALEAARSRGASQAEAAVSQNSGLSVGVRLGEVETLEHQRDRAASSACSMIGLRSSRVGRKECAGARAIMISDRIR
jgi:hypothetical protein